MGESRFGDIRERERERDEVTSARLGRLFFFFFFFFFPPLFFSLLLELYSPPFLLGVFVSALPVLFLFLVLVFSDGLGRVSKSGLALYQHIAGRPKRTQKDTKK